MGGYSTIFMATTLGYASSHFGLVSASPLATPITSNAGLRSLARNVAVIAGPTFVGFVIGLNTFGQPSELWNLVKNGSKYRREFKSLRRELYYK